MAELHSLPLIYLSTLRPRSYCNDYCNSIVNLEIWDCKSHSFVLFKNCFGHSRFFEFTYKFQNKFVNFLKKILLGF